MTTTDRSFMKSLFGGVIEQDLVFPYPELKADERENLSLMLDNVQKFCETRVDSKKIDKEHTIPEEVLAGMKELGLFGLSIPEEYGGLGLSTTSYARVMQEVAAYDASLAVTMGAHQSIGCKAIVLLGTEAQKRKYLPRLASGEQVAAFALTEPGAGSDAASITTRAELSPDGEHYILNGSKIWITNGGFADVFTVFARTTELDPSAKPKITALIVERAHGVKNGPNEEKMGIRGSSTTEIFFDDVRVPAGNVIGEAGRGFKVAMEVLNNGRLGLAAGCVGASKRLIDMATERVNERKAFGRSIGDFGMIKEKIARMVCETYALESMTYLTTGLVDAKVADYSVESAICKVFGSETLWSVVNETLQIAAGIGYMVEYPYERLMRDSRINMIFEGTNEILRAFIALAGMQGPGRQLAEVARAMREPIKGFGPLSEYVIQRARSVIGRERLSRAHPVLARETVLFEQQTAALAAATERVLRKHGKDIAEKQFVQKRIAEVAIDLYAMAATLSRTTRAIEARGEEGARREIELCQGFAIIAEKRLADRLGEMERDSDELLKSIATRAYEDRGYPLDIV
ncbi:acyl-CoA dehydrogenase family protein [Sandaracinus amylolyticus]|uniref:acyl-CoA dehydrogenase family protein n=1 Tax=Sandaracinus amylolyticus TaxID=927083 RepID=UPI001F237BA4|nr:acyl-CoA dehydrogenase family protein [Sandaracinus amylolyticus]UJR81024.1 Acyl-CoA dehydrogenase, short-chain specific [Sandaracinus amylolyticus]